MYECLDPAMFAGSKYGFARGRERERETERGDIYIYDCNHDFNNNTPPRNQWNQPMNRRMIVKVYPIPVGGPAISAPFYTEFRTERLFA